MHTPWMYTNRNGTWPTHTFRSLAYREVLAECNSKRAVSWFVMVTAPWETSAAKPLAADLRVRFSIPCVEIPSTTLPIAVGSADRPAPL